LKSKISTEGYLIVVSQRNRSQLINKEDCVKKFYAMLEKAFRPVKVRKKTKPTISSIEKRLTGKKVKARIKENRKQIDE
jgi:ribosome-associated protein